MAAFSDTHHISPECDLRTFDSYDFSRKTLGAPGPSPLGTGDGSTTPAGAPLTHPSTLLSFTKRNVCAPFIAALSR